MKKTFGITLLLMLALLFTSCYRDNKEEIYKNFDQAGCDTTDTKFSTTVQPIFIDNCALSGCHVGSSPQSGLDLSTYTDIETIASDGRLEKRITNNPGPIMPPSGALPQCEINKILKWVSNGAQNN